MMPGVLTRRVPAPPAPERPRVTPLVEAWPLHFVKISLDGVRNPLRAGDLFESQDKRTIRGWGSCFGLTDAEVQQLPFTRLPFVATLVAPTRAAADQIVRTGMTLEEARRFLGGKGNHGKSE